MPVKNVPNEDPAGKQDESQAFITTEELFDEVRRRSSVCALMWAPKTNAGDGFDWGAKYGGNLDPIIALMEKCKWHLQESVYAPTNPRPTVDLIEAMEDESGAEDDGEESDEGEDE